MICKLKTLKGDTFDLECTPDMKVSAVKEKAAACAEGLKLGWEAAGMKLIFQGKVLDDAKHLAGYSINDNDFMVVMYSKPKNKPAAARAAAASPAPATEAAPAAAAAPAPAAPARSAPAAAHANTFSPEAQQAIDSLVEMGYATEDVKTAMVAAFMDPDRAAQYLEEGLPDAGDDAMQADEEDSPTPTTWAELNQNRQFLREIASITDQNSLQVYLSTLSTQDPQKLQLIQSHPQPFAALLNAVQSQGAASPPGGTPAGAPLPIGMAAQPGGGGGGGGGGAGGGLPPGLQQLMAQNPEMLEGLLQNPEMLAQLLQVRTRP